MEGGGCQEDLRAINEQIRVNMGELVIENQHLYEALDKISKLTEILYIDMSCSLEAQFSSREECDMAVIYHECQKALARQYAK